MSDILRPVNKPTRALKVAAGKDAFGEQRGLGISRIRFKVCPEDERGILIIENVFSQKGGPPRHLHHGQDEWFYVLESEFVFEVGPDRFKLTPGDALLAPREVPHVWAHSGNAEGKILIAFLPAGKMGAFFHEVSKANAMPPQDPELWRAHGMELLGPPLPVK